MANFFLIDQSLKGVGGHHFDYSYQIATAAMNGHSVIDSINNRSDGNSSSDNRSKEYWPDDSKLVIGANRKFSQFDSFPQCEVRSCFRYTTYSPSSNLVGIQEMVGRRKKAGWLKSLLFGGDHERSNSADRENRISTFRENLHSFFCEGLNKSDIVFFTTLSDLEAEGLRQFISDRSDAKKANWHLQFHFPIFLGRTDEYAEQQFRLESVRPVFEKLELLRRETNIRYYVTSQPLREQYNRLGFDFEDLPYPIDPNFGHEDRVGRDAASEEMTDQAFRLTFAGASRKEKGELAVRGLATELPADFVRSNNIKIVTQQKKQKFWRRLKERFQGEANETKKPCETEPNMFEALRFPLSDSQYRDMIKRTNIGLLTTYDSRTYFSRRAGILGEYLAAGVPVIVPAGCWLSQQIEAVQQGYLRNIIRDEAKRPTEVATKIAGDAMVQVDVPDLDHQNDHQADPDGVSSSRLVVLRITAAHENYCGDFVQVSQLDDSGQSIESQIVGASPNANMARSVKTEQNDVRHFAFYAKGAGCLRFRIEKAFQKTAGNKAPNSKFDFSKVTAKILDSKEVIPRSAVGMVAADPSQATELIQEMVSQYSHYKATADAHAIEWYRTHDPKLTFSTLLNRSHSLLELDLETNDSKEKPERTAA